MNFRFRVLRGSILLGIGQIVGYAASFARNMLLARALSRADFGISAAFALTITAFELSNKMAIGQQVVQSRSGDSEQFQATAHLCQFVAGALGTILISLFGGTMANLFQIPDARWAFTVISVIGVLNGLQHLDVVRLTRHLCFGPKVMLDLLPDTITTIAAFVLLHWLRDYRVVVILLVAKSVLGVIISHVLAERCYGWCFNKDYLRAILIFGWPLFLNSLLMFGYMQGDQVFIGAFFSVASLALYSLAVQITTVPGMMFMNVLTPIFLPLLSRAQDDLDLYRRRYVLCSEIATMSAALLACFLLTSGGYVMITAFGSKYAGAGSVITMLAVANAIRIIRGVPTIAGMARGDTVNNLIANLVRVVSLPLAVIAVMTKSPMSLVAACAVVGECLALLASWYRLRIKCGVPIWDGIRSSMAACLVVAATAIPAYIIDLFSPLFIGLAINLAVCMVAALFLVLIFGELRGRIIEELRKVPAAIPFVRFLTWAAGKRIVTTVAEIEIVR
jgi:O-antigen/teichoic acid export membrane protein